MITKGADVLSAPLMCILGKTTEDKTVGLFDVFKKSAPAADVHDPAEDYDRTPSQDIIVNLTEDKIEINGKSYAFPIQLTELVELFGEPEKFVFGKMYIDVLSEKQNAYLNQTTPQRLNFVWHDLGIKAYCYDRVTVRALQFQFRPYIYREMPTASPSNMFGGKLTINGQPWFELIKPVKPESSGSYTKGFKFGVHKIHGAFTTPEMKDNLRTEKDYTNLEIALDAELSETFGQPK